MVTIQSYVERKSADGRKFYSLILQGGLEMVVSEKTGRYYATAKTASITSTFDEPTCKSLVGTKIHGRITKVACEPYDHVIQETGEVVKLSHRWVFTPGEASPDEMVLDEKQLVKSEAFTF